MKSRILIATAALLVLTALNPGKAKAWGYYPPSNPPKSTPLPIDNGVAILTIAGMLMGAVVIKKSTPTLKLVTVKA